MNAQSNFKVINYSSKEALRRSGSIPRTSVVGASGAGKSSIIEALLGEEHGKKLSSVLKGENAQTTKISTLFILDSRIESDTDFSLKVILKEFNGKVVLDCILEELYNSFKESDYIAMDTLDALDEEFFRKILTPMNALYDLSKFATSISLKELKTALTPILHIIEEKDGKTFDDLAKERKKNLNSKTTKLAIIRKNLFQDLWDEYSKALDMSPLTKWLDNIEILINESLEGLLHGEIDEKRTVLTLTGQSLDNKVHELTELFVKSAPYSLIIEEVHYVCKPHTSLIDIHNKKYMENYYPFRLAIRDTMGFTQSGTEQEDIEEGLDIAFSFETDSILIVLNLNERKDDLNIFMQCINRKLDKYLNKKNRKKPVNLLFTHVDEVIELKIGSKRTGTTLTQQDYTNHVPECVESMEKEIQETVETNGKKHEEELYETDWLSLFYKDHTIDPIQTALNDDESYRVKFQPKGLYEYIVNVAKEGQRSLLPPTQSEVLIVSPGEYDIPPVSISVKLEAIDATLKPVQQALLHEANKKVYRDNIVDNKYLFNGRSVAAYWRKLSIGEGHKTRAEVYANFNLNMKALIGGLIRSDELKTLVINKMDLSFVNLRDDDLKKACRYFRGYESTEIARTVLEEQLTEGIRNHLAKDFIYNEVVDRVAFKASYGNGYIKAELSKAYRKEPSYDSSIRNVQNEYYKLFKKDTFLSELAVEFGNELSSLLNKSFVVI